MFQSRNLWGLLTAALICYRDSVPLVAKEARNLDRSREDDDETVTTPFLALDCRFANIGYSELYSQQDDSFTIAVDRRAN